VLVEDQPATAVLRGLGHHIAAAGSDLEGHVELRLGIDHHADRGRGIDHAERGLVTLERCAAQVAGSKEDLAALAVRPGPEELELMRATCTLDRGAEDDLVEVEQDLTDLLPDPRDARKSVIDPGDLHAPDADPGHRGDEHRSNGLTQSLSVSALERLENQLALVVFLRDVPEEPKLRLVELDHGSFLSRTEVDTPRAACVRGGESRNR
jgi:hypothetical protein